MRAAGGNGRKRELEDESARVYTAEGSE